MPKGITMNPVHGSTTINAAGYDPETQTMAIEFSNGASYDIFDVPQSTWDGFMNAGSKGSYYGRRIKGFYTTVKR